MKTVYRFIGLNLDWSVRHTVAGAVIEGYATHQQGHLVGWRTLVFFKPVIEV